MIINNKANILGKDYVIKYHDAVSFEQLPIELITQVYGVCFYGKKIVITHNKKGHWSLVGGTVEKGEHYEQTLVREVQEESNMDVLLSLPIGYQETQSVKGKKILQLRYVCIVQPYGPFDNDPDDSIDAIKLIEPRDVKKYFDWGEIGARIIQRAVELKESL